MSYRKFKDPEIFSYNLTKILSIAIMGIGVIVLIGWFLDIDILKSLSPIWVTMKFSTALSFVMSGMILYFMNEAERRNSEYARMFLLGPMIVILFFMVTLLVSTVAGISTGIQDIFIKEEVGALKSVAPGVPSVGTMVNFLLVHISSIILLFNLANRRKIFSLIASGITAIGGLAILGYTIDVEVFYYTIEGFSTAMALHTAITFVLIGVGMFFLAKGKEIEKAFLSHRTSIKTKIMIIFLPGTMATLILMVAIHYSFTQKEMTLEAIKQLEYLEIPVIIAISALVIHASLFFANSISDPINRLRKVTNQIAQGNLDVKIKAVTNDEIGDLASTFDNMREHVKEMTQDLRAQTEDLVAANKDLIRKDRQKEELTSMIAHELRTPLTPITGYADLLLSEQMGKLNESQREKIKIIKSSAESLQKLIVQLSDIQKIEFGVLKINKELVVLTDIINSSIVKLRQELDKKDIILSISLQENVTCLCDKERIGQVLNNLIYNAIDFCPTADGKIKVTLTSTKNDAEITVEDKGIGIPEDQLKKIFEKFYQVDSSLTRDHGGTGLGLSICKGIIESHSGKIWAESELGKGTKIHILLPSSNNKEQNLKISSNESEEISKYV